MSLEANKIAAAILVGGMLTLSVGLVSNVIYGPHEGHEGGEAAAPAEAAPAPKAIEPVSGLLAAADVAKGAEVAKKCQTCHDFTNGGPNKVGPNLWGVVGNKHGHKEDFAYSDAIKSIDKPWGYEELNHFITNPKKYAPGTKMTFPGLPKVEDRANLIAWLRTQADSPVALPTADEIKAAEDEYKAQQDASAAPVEAAPAAAPAATQTAEAPAAAAPAQDPLALIAAADPAKGEKIAVKCKACHDFTNDGKNKVGPNLWNVVGGKTAHKDDFNYSDAIKGLNGTWDFASLDKYLTNPKAFVAGNKMAFPGLPKAEDRAALIRWLRDQSDSPIPLPQ